MKRFTLNIAGLFVAVVAVLFDLKSLYLMAAILWLIPAVSYLMGWLMLGGLTCVRALPVSASAGETLLLTYTLGNTSRLPKFYLSVRDTLLGSFSLPDGPPPLVLGVWPGEERTTQCLVEAKRRGVFPLGPTLIYSTDPLGLQTFSQKALALDELIVYPALLPIAESWPRGAASVGWRGSASAQTRGDGDDFYGVREYALGDDLRRVHWRTTARTGALAVAEYSRGITLDAVIALDLSRDAYTDTKDGVSEALEAGVRLAATLADDLLRHGYAVRLLMAGATADETQARSGAETARFLERLARVRPDASETLADVLEGDRGGTRGEAALIVISPAGTDPRLIRQGDDWKARGGQVFRFLLDARSFQTGTPGLPDSLTSSNTRLVRRGDDLRDLLERRFDG